MWDPKRVIFCFDHFFQPDWIPYRAALEHPKVRAFAKEQNVPDENVYDVGRNGISHHIPVEQGYALPGTICIGADTQSAMMGAVNCFAMPAFASVEHIILNGEIWLIVPEAVKINLTGALGQGLSGKDVVYRLIHDLGGKIDGKVLEFAGPGVASLSVDARMAICNGAFQLGAATMIFPHDDLLARYLTDRAREPFVPVEADGDARYAATYDYDLSTFAPLVAGPHEIELVRALPEVMGLPIDAAYIGSCSSGRLSDLRLAANVLRGHKISPSVRLVVTPDFRRYGARCGARGAHRDISRRRSGFYAARLRRVRRVQYLATQACGRRAMHRDLGGGAARPDGKPRRRGDAEQRCRRGGVRDRGTDRRSGALP